MTRRSEVRAIRQRYGKTWRPPAPMRALTPKERVRRAKNWTKAFIVPRLAANAWERMSWPLTALFVLGRAPLHPAYRMTVWRKAKLAWRLYRTTQVVVTGTSYRAHLVMALKILSLAPEEEGVVVECGSFQGGSTANLSTICTYADRELVVYDSFEGLPPPSPGDRAASVFGTGLYAGSLETVKANVAMAGNLDVCTFRKGWFADTMASHTEPVVFAFVDVDYQASLHDCVQGLWPHLTEHGYFFIDDYVFNDYCALFWSEEYWRRYFDTTPPGLLGSGSGVPVGGFYPGSWTERTPMTIAASTAYTRKDFSGFWTYYPEDVAEEGAPLTD